MLNLASTFDSELQLREGIYLPTQFNMAHFTTYVLQPFKQIYLYIYLPFPIFYHALLIRELVLPLFFGHGPWFRPDVKHFQNFNFQFRTKSWHEAGIQGGYLNINCWKMDKNSSDWLMGNVLTEASQLFTLGFLWFTEHMFDILLNCFHLNTPRSH